MLNKYRHMRRDFKAGKKILGLNDIKLPEFYAYEIENPMTNETFYVGKGAKFRVLQHFSWPPANLNREKQKIIDEAIEHQLIIKAKLHICCNEEQAADKEYQLLTTKLNLVNRALTVPSKNYEENIKINYLEMEIFIDTTRLT